MQIVLPAMSIPESIAPAPASPGHAGPWGMVAAATIGLQALGCAGFSVFFLFATAHGATLSGTSHLMFSVITATFGLGLGCVARGLWLGLSWPRAAAVVWLVVLLPVGLAMVQADRGLVGGLVLGGAVVGIGAVAVESRGTVRL